MKKVLKNRLALHKEVVRELSRQQLERAQGGISLFNCNTESACVTKTCPSYAPCSVVSRSPGC